MFHTERQHLSSHRGVFAAVALSIFLVMLPANSMAEFTTSSTFPVHSNATGDTGDDLFPRFATDGANNWVAVWNSDEDLGPGAGGDLDIFVSRSSDNGVTWGAAFALNTNATTDVGDDFDVHIETDGTGVWIAVWDSEVDLGGIGTDYDILFSRSTDNGATWSAPAVLNSNAATDTGGDFVPMTVSAGGGVWVAFWESEDDLGISLDSDFDILFSRSTDNGMTWSAPAALNSNAATDTGIDRFVRVTSDGGANWVAVWESDEDLGGLAGTDFDIFVAISSDSGVNWGPTVVLEASFGPDTGHDFLPVPLTDAAGNWIVVWHSLQNVGGTIGTDSDILVSRSSNNGVAWSTPEALNINASTDSGQDQNPVVSVDSVGNWTVAWESTDDLSGTVGTDFDILAAVSTNAGVSWTFPRAINTDAATDSGNDVFPSLGIKGDASLVYVWHSSDDLSGTVGLDNDVLYANAIIFFPVVGTTSVGGCFIATAAYGTPLDARLDTLREFRDKHLLSNLFGSAFVDTYYRLSPSLADRIAENSAFAAVARLFLAPIIALVSIFSEYPIGTALLPMCAFAFALLFVRRRTTSKLDTEGF